MKILKFAVISFACGFALGVYLPRATSQVVLELSPESYSGELHELLDLQGPFVNIGDSHAATPAARFMTAMVLGGFTNKRTEFDLSRAWMLLNELHQSNRDNGAYLYYRLAVEARAGHSAEQLERTGFQILRAEKFEDPLTSLYAELNRRFLRQGDRGARRLLMQLPHIDETVVFTAVENYLSGTGSVRKHLAHLMGGTYSASAAEVLGKNHSRQVVAKSVALNLCPAWDNSLRAPAEAGRDSKANFVSNF